MAVSMETQRLISVSLGKIQQSRGQRGGINLHKNLLVATVLHKARNAYMIESYSYQQNIHRQKLMEHYQLQQSISSQKLESTPVVEPNKGESVTHDCHSNQISGAISSDCHLAQISTSSTHDSVSSDIYLSESSTTTTDPASCDYQLGQVNATPTEPISHVGQLGATLTGQDLIRSDVSSESAPEPMSALYAALSAQDKENSPPSGEDQPNNVQENVPFSETRTSSSFQDDHIAAAVQLSQDAQMASSCEHNLKQQTLTSGSTTCNVLKRRRDNQSSSLHEFETPVSKIARLLQHDNPTPTTSYSNFNTSDDSRSSESQISNNSSSSDSNQILNLVNIFNSGFSGLCAAAAASNSDLHASNYQIEYDISQSHTRKIATKAG